MAIRIDRDEFLRNLQQSGLLSEREFRDALPRLPDSDRGRVVARALVDMGLLTRFQAELLLAGRTSGFLLGQYRILEQLGRGGMGRVFKAIHQTMNRTVALKLLAPQLVKTAKARDLFHSEVRNAAKLIHPNIVTAYDANRIGDRHFLVMEFVDGPNLDQLVRERGPLPVGLACEIIRQLANGLQYAHEMGMVHRDIKPANILVQLTGKNQELSVKILDFGLARLHEGESDKPRDTAIMGTPDFLSPEQGVNSQDVDVRSDLYSVGCTFYWLLTGRVPFPGGTSLEKLERQKNEEPPPVEETRSDVPAAVASIVRRLMAKYPPHRFQSPADLATALAPYAVAASPALTGRRDPTPLDSSADMQAARPSDAGMGTLPPDFSATPLSSLGLHAPWEERKSRLKSFLWAIAIVAVLVGSLTVMLLLGLN